MSSSSNNLLDVKPSKQAQQSFYTSLSNLSKFTVELHKACRDYISNKINETQFNLLVKNTNLTNLHSELPSILIKWSVEEPTATRQAVLTLLKHLFESNVINQQQMDLSVRKIYTTVNELITDVPNALELVNEHVKSMVELGLLSENTAKECKSIADSLKDEVQAMWIKSRFSEIIQDYFTGGEVKECAVALEDMNAKDSPLEYEFVKQLISISMDKSNHEREEASLLMSLLRQNDQLKQDQAVKGFNILLERAEDIALDVPAVLQLFSCFIARAIADSVLPTDFTTNNSDVMIRDCGSQILNQAQNLLQAAGNDKDKLKKIWHTA